MSKKALCAAVILAAGIAALTACGSVSSVSPGVTTTAQNNHPLDQSPNQPYH